MSANDIQARTIDARHSTLGNAIPSSANTLRKRGAQDVDDPHAARLFVGPMPMKVAAPIAMEGHKRATKHWWHISHDREYDDQGDDEESISDNHAFQFFLQQGGHEEEWDARETVRKSTKHEILQRWRQSDWNTLSHPKNKGSHPHQKWVGQTFQIGQDFLGVPMQTAGDVKSSAAKSPKSLKPLDTPGSVEASTSKAASASYRTAPEEHPESFAEESPARSSTDHNNHLSEITNGSGVPLLPKNEPLKHHRSMPLPRILSTNSMASRAMTDGQIRSTKFPSRIGAHLLTSNGDPVSSRSPLRSALRRLQSDRGKGKAVQFSSLAEEQAEEPAPVPPAEVLTRRPSTNPDTSDAATAAIQNQEPLTQNVKYGDVSLSDRMLVRRFQVKSGDTGSYFDAEQAMKVRDLLAYEWKEYLVVWRRGQLELYDNHSIPYKERILGRKHLAYVIPLQKPATKLSLYSFTDLTFCLTCSTLHVAKDFKRAASNLAMMQFRQLPYAEIFVFKGKTRSRSIDWMWNIWRWLGHEIPRSIDVYFPITENRVRLHIPEFDPAGGEGYKIFRRDLVVESCRSALKGLHSWYNLVEERLNRGARIGLCWRRDDMLDWIYWDKDTEGNTRDWEVLYGLCLNKPQEITHLEARLAEHRPINVILSDGKHLREPSAVEGYLYRIRPGSQSRTHAYISTHNGCLFSTNAGRAQPPRPPIPIDDDTAGGEGAPLPFQESELRRETVQILQSDFLIDLRDVVVVRKAFQVYAPLQDSVDNHPADGTEPQGQEDGRVTAEAEEDAGGDEVLSRHHDKSHLKMRRSFELVMGTGEVLRFEAYSCSVALEWITHLTDLTMYWRHRHRVDAREEMEMMHAVKGNSTFALAHPAKEPFPEGPPDYDQSSEYLPIFWNWCVLEGCSSVIKSGRVFLRRGYRSQFRLTQLILVSGHLIQFNMTHRVAQHFRSKTTSLLDAYICSGHFAIQALPADEFSVTSEPLPRRFQDGLENDDPEFDKVLLIWYRPQAIGKTKVVEAPVSGLNAKRKLVVLKARSRLERNAWCWALNAEIERISRSSDREARVRMEDSKLIA